MNTPIPDPHHDHDDAAGPSPCREQRVRIGSLSDVVAVVPYMLTYVPRDAVAVLAFAGTRLRVTACLPVPALDDIPLAAWRLNRVLTRASRHHDDAGGGATLLLVVGYGSPVIDPALTALAGELALPVGDVVRVQEDRWWCLTCLDRSCCPPGAKVEAAEHVSLALQVAVGPPAAARPDRAREVQPAPGRLLDQVLDAIALRSATAVGEWPVGERYALLQDARAARRLERAPLHPLDAAGLLLALADLRVRDGCTLWHDQAALHLWLDLVRLAPPGWVAPVATLLAFTAHQRGDSVLAMLALDRALDDDSTYALAGLLREVISLGIPPQECTAYLQQMSEEVLARLDLGHPGPQARGEASGGRS